MGEAPRSAELLDRRRSRVLLIDLQERLLNAIPSAGEVVARARLLSEGAALLAVPISVTEQYPQGLGATVGELTIGAVECVSKLAFSAADSLKLVGATYQDEDRDQVVIAGVEAHVCVLQTACDLLARGYRVYVAADAVASRRSLDAEIALQRLRDCGATLTTVESVLFELCESAASPQFKALSQLVKIRTADSTVSQKNSPDFG